MENQGNERQAVAVPSDCDLLAPGGSSMATAEPDRAARDALARIVLNAPIGLYAIRWSDDAAADVIAGPVLAFELGLAAAELGDLRCRRERIHPVDWPSIGPQLERFFETGSFAARYRMRTRDGSYRWMDDRLTLLPRRPGGVLEAVGVLLDIDERRQAEAHLLQQTKLMTLGEMAASMAHELNQPLNIIRLAIDNLRFLVDRRGLAELGLDYVRAKLDRIGEQITRAARLVDHMRVFGRKPTAEPTSFKVADAVAQTVSLIQEQLRLAGIGLVVTLEDAAAEIRVKGSIELLDQVLLNLVVNARDAVLERGRAPRAGTPRVTICVRALEEGRAVLISVEDTGPGIPDHVLPRMFEPFFTTKPAGSGTGLGLSIVFGIVRDMGGTITAANIEGGARLAVRLPVAPDGGDPAPTVAWPASGSR